MWGAFLSLWLALFGLASLPTKIFTGAHDPTPYTNRQIRRVRYNLVDVLRVIHANDSV